MGAWREGPAQELSPVLGCRLLAGSEEKAHEHPLRAGCLAGHDAFIKLEVSCLTLQVWRLKNREEIYLPRVTQLVIGHEASRGICLSTWALPVGALPCSSGRGPPPPLVLMWHCVCVQSLCSSPTLTWVLEQLSLVSMSLGQRKAWPVLIRGPVNDCPLPQGSGGASSRASV